MPIVIFLLVVIILILCPNLTHIEHIIGCNPIIFNRLIFLVEPLGALQISALPSNLL